MSPFSLFCLSILSCKSCESLTERETRDQIIVPTIDADDSFVLAARSWLAGNPREILIITEHSVLPAMQDLADRVNDDVCDGRNVVKVLSVPKANKRLQMAEGIRATQTDIIVFADDDALWPSTLLPLILAPFEDEQVGGVGTSQSVLSHQPNGSYTLWETLAAFRLSIRNIEIAASTHIDGGIPCLSGRTAAYRTLILKDPAFLDGFTNDYWLGKYLLNSGDDKFLTRWMVSRGWSTYVQVMKDAEVRSTMKPDWRFLKQVLRWTRNTWRSDLRSVFVERVVWTRHPYTTYTMIGPCLVIYLLIRSTQPSPAPTKPGAPIEAAYNLPPWNVVISWFVWLTLTRAMKLAPHLVRRPRDIIYVPAWVLFGYFFAVLKIYALCTLHRVGWGTRESVGDPAIASAAEALKKREAQDLGSGPGSGSSTTVITSAAVVSTTTTPSASRRTSAIVPMRPLEGYNDHYQVNDWRDDDSRSRDTIGQAV